MGVGKILPPAERDEEQRDGQQLHLQPVAHRGPENEGAALRHQRQDGEAEHQAVHRLPVQPRARQQIWNVEQPEGNQFNCCQSVHPDTDNIS